MRSIVTIGIVVALTVLAARSASGAEDSRPAAAGPRERVVLTAEGHIVVVRAALAPVVAESDAALLPRVAELARDAARLGGRLDTAGATPARTRTDALAVTVLRGDDLELEVTGLPDPVAPLVGPHALPAHAALLRLTWRFGGAGVR